MPIPSEGDVRLRHLAIDGPIGVGKTSLVGMLARKFRGTKILEDVDNPFLPDFYKRKKGAAFQTQLFFLLVALPAAAGDRADRPVLDAGRRGLHFPEGQDLRVPEPRRLGAADLRQALHAPVRVGPQARSRHLPAGIDRDVPQADQEEEGSPSRRRHTGIPRAADRGLQLLLLPLRGDAAPRRRHQRDRLRRTAPPTSTTSSPRSRRSRRACSTTSPQGTHRSDCAAGRGAVIPTRFLSSRGALRRGIPFEPQFGVSRDPPRPSRDDGRGSRGFTRSDVARAPQRYNRLLALIGGDPERSGRRPKGKERR